MKLIKRAIVIDDEEGVRETLKDLMEMLGYEIETFKTPLEFFCNESCCCASGPCCDILISDFNMPGMNGGEFISILRGKGCRIKKIAIMSGIWNGEAKTAAEKFSCEFLKKPFGLEELKAVL